jgi:hypothetical protein
MSNLPDDFRKSVFAVHIKPVDGALNLKARKLQITLARMAGEQYRRLTTEQRQEIEDAARRHINRLREGRRGEAPEILLQPRFQAKLTDIAEAVHHDPAIARQMMPDLKMLVGVKVEFNSLRHKAAEIERDLYPDELTVVTTLLSSVVKTGRGWVSWAYDPLILSIMVNPKTYAQLNLSLVRNARTYTALALYENVKRFIGIGRAGPYPTKRWQELLSENGKIPDWEDSAELKRKVRRALAELEQNENSDIDIKMKDCRMPLSGEKALEFEVRMRPQTKLTFGEPVPEDRTLVTQMAALGYNASEVRGLVDARGEEYIYAKLALLKQAKNVENPRGWLAAAIARDYQDKEAQEQASRLELGKTQKKKQERERLHQEFQQLRSTRLRERLQQMPIEQQQEWRAKFAESPEGRAALSTKLSKAAKEASLITWLVGQPGWLKEEEEQDFASFILWKQA